MAELDTKWLLRFQESLPGYRNMSMEIFFLKGPGWKAKAFSGYDLLIDIPVLTRFLCEALKRLLEIWPSVSGKTFLSAPMPRARCLKAQCPGQRAALYFVMTSPGGPRCGDTAHKSLSLRSLQYTATLSMT